MDSGNVSAIISASAGIIGVILGNSFLAIKEWRVSQSKRKKDAAYLAIIVVSHLDRFSNRCFHIALDDGTEYGRPAENHEKEYSPTTKSPAFQPLDINVEWKVLPQDLMYEIMIIPEKLEQIENRLAGILEFYNDYPDHTEYFLARRRDYADLGLITSDLARKLRKYVGMPIEDISPNEWSRDQELRVIINRIDEDCAAYERRKAESRT